MNLGEKLYELRKKKNLSQENAAEKLNVTRQTISKWETNQSTPDFDKIIPLCELYEISTDELLRGYEKSNQTESTNYDEISIDQRKSRAKAISISVFLYFISIIWIIVAEPLTIIDDNLLVGIFLLICAIATVNLIYKLSSIPKAKTIEIEKQNKYKRLDGIIASIFTLVYLLISFLTMAWHITWLIWIIFSIVIEIIHLILDIKENKNEEK